MITYERIEELTKEAIPNGAMFIGDILIKKNNVIYVFLDSDDFVSINDCVKVSKHIEHHLDRDAEDFELHVSSFGADRPLIHDRQYQKCIGKEIAILLEDNEQIMGEFLDFNDSFFKIFIPAKKKKDIPFECNIERNKIKEIKRVLSIKIKE